MTGAGRDSVGAEDEFWLRRAIELAGRCPPSDTAYSVGAVVVYRGAEISSGFSRDTDPVLHAEESALRKLGVTGEPGVTDEPGATDERLAAATIYSSLEPCSRRASRPHPCLELILRAGIPRVVIAWREPPLFVTNCVGVERLRQAGVEVTELPELAAAALAPNRHLRLEQ